MFPELCHTHHSLHQEDIPFWLELASQTGDPILELGCGTGRVLVPLACAGHRCLGLDRDFSMLRFLRLNLDEHITFTPMLVTADMSQFSLVEQFALILLPCNTFSTLDAIESRACLSCVHKHLLPDGLFAVSSPNPDLVEHLPAESEVELEDEFFHPHTGNPVQISSSWKRTERSFIVTWIYDQLFPDGTVERLTVETTHQRRSVQTYLEEFQSMGLRVQNLYGDFNRSAYTSASPNLIIVATIR